MRKNLTQVVLPIAIIVGLVFGITWIMNYTPPSTYKPVGDEVVIVTDTGTPPLKMYRTIANHTNPELRFWKSDCELDEPGHFDFWFQNPNKQEVRATFQNPNCQCAGAELALVPAEALNNCALQPALAALAGHPAQVFGLNALAVSLAAASGVSSLEPKIQWHPLLVEGKSTYAVVPPGAPDAPQFGILRLKWKGKDPVGEPHTLRGDFAANFPNAIATVFPLEAKFMVVPSFGLYVVGSRTPSSIPLGDLSAYSVSHRELLCFSKTRPEMHIEVTGVNVRDEIKDCVEWTKPEPLSPAELLAFSQATSEDPRNPVVITSAYRVKLSVYERREIEQDGKKVLKQLELGPIGFQLKFTGDNGKGLAVPVLGYVRGDVRISGGPNIERIDMGSFKSRDSKEHTVRLFSNRVGLDLELLPKECTPEYVELSLKPDGEQDGRKQWLLNIQIPAGKLYGNLTNAYVILQTKDSPPRRIRIPIKASTSTGGGF